MNNRDRLGAVCTLGCIARLQPTYLLSPQFRSRLFHPQNLKRLRDLVALVRRSEQSGLEV
jgi:hypothetical protein